MATFIGDGGNNTLTGSALPDDLLGLGGDDTLIGGESGDDLNGGTGASAQIQFALLNPGLALTNFDFLVVA